MNNLLSYIRWRGDIRFTERPFNEVDNLIFSMLSYVDFTEIVSEKGREHGITLKDAVTLLSNINKMQDRMRYRSLVDLPPTFLEELAESRRFSGSKLYFYQDIHDEKRQIQFAALHIELEDKSIYIAFRGTDQSILGWREDFNMSFQITPAQQEAAKYLRDTLIYQDVTYYIGGHSKGGNLAVYSAMKCDNKLGERISYVYNNDGPGLSGDMIQTEAYNRIRDKIIRIVPQFSVIGMLFEHDSNVKIVRSSAHGLLQHDGMTWEVEGEYFCQTGKLVKECVAINQMFDTWLENVNLSQRKVFTDNFFDALEASGAKNINEIGKEGVRGFESILTGIVASEKDTKGAVLQLFTIIFERVKKINFLQLYRNKGILRGISIGLLGIFFMQLSEHALQILGTAVVCFFIIFGMQRFFHYYYRRMNKELEYSVVVIFYLICVLLLLFLVIQKSVFLVALNVSLGLIFSGYGILTLKDSMGLDRRKKRFWWFASARGVLAVVLGIVAFVIQVDHMSTYVFAVGTLMIIEGLRQIVIEIERNTRETVEAD
jgi:hypothetical protein